MAIFEGTWLDGEGVPFAANAHQHQAYTGGGTAQGTSTAPWGTDMQWGSVFNFMRCAAQWTNDLVEQERQQWRDDSFGMGSPERRRFPVEGWGYRLWLSVQIPCMLPGVTQYVSGRFPGEYPPMYILGPYREENHVTVRMQNAWEWIEGRSHLEVFEIDPEHIEDQFPCEHSHLLHSFPGWLNGDYYSEWDVWTFFDRPEGQDPYLFIRAWHIHYFTQSYAYAEPWPY